MLLGVERLVEELRAVGRRVDGPFASGGMQWLVVPDYVIPGGRFFGQTVSVAVPVQPDYPQTPPGGFYINVRLIPANEMATLRVHDRPETAQLPGTWQYWSRPLPGGLPAENGARRLMTHWNSVMCLVM